MFNALNENEYILIIKKSKFKAFSYNIKTIDKAKEIININKEKFKDASHVVYAYKIGKLKYAYSDAREPHNTAGKPVYNSLEYNDLTDILIIVIRYFGGIKLGTGGLIKAYSTVSRALIEKLNLTNRIEYIKLNIECNYKNYGRLKNILLKYEVAFIKEEFLTQIILDLEINKELYNDLVNSLKEIKDIIIKN